MSIDPTLLEASKAPGPPGHFLLGNFAQVSQSRQLAHYIDWQGKYGEFLRIEAPKGFAWYFVGAPDDIQQFLLGSYHDFYKGTFWNRVRRVLGNGLLTNDGELWRGHRRALQPAFHQNFLADFSAQMMESIAAMLDRWEAWAEEGREIDVMAEMSRVTLQNAGVTLFSIDFAPLYDEMGQELEFVVRKMNANNFAQSWVLDPRLRRSLKKLHRIIGKFVADRRKLIEHGTAPQDMLTALIKGRDGEGRAFTDQEIHDEILTFIFVGHETTALSLAWAWRLLGDNPECEARAAAEVREVLQGGLPTFEDTKKLDYVRQVFLETLRLYPPVWGIARKTTKEVTLHGYRVPANTILIALPYVTHRHPEYWEDPEKFDPTRFEQEKVEARHKFAYFPFGGGPRLCIGLHFALLEAQLVIASVLSRYKLVATENNSSELVLWATLRPKHGVMMKLEKRTSSMAPAMK